MNRGKWINEEQFILETTAAATLGIWKFLQETGGGTAHQRVLLRALANLSFAEIKRSGRSFSQQETEAYSDLGFEVTK